MQAFLCRARAATLLGVLAVLGGSAARADSFSDESQQIFVQGHELIDQGHFVIGVGGAFGVELNGPKLVIGWAWPRAQVSIALSGGALVLPFGPGAMLEVSGEWVALPTTLVLFGTSNSMGAVIGGHFGAKLTSITHPAFHLEGIGQYQSTQGTSYAFAAVGFPEIFELGAGQRLVPHDGVGPYGELRFGIPMLVNGEMGFTGLPIR